MMGVASVVCVMLTVACADVVSSDDATEKEPTVKVEARSPFSCETPRTIVPLSERTTSVHRLRPQDVSVVAALGDSISSGLGARANNWLTMPLSFSGVAFSIGGAEDLHTVVTLPNILRQFANITGYSLGLGIGRAGLNVALPNSEARHMPAQARDLVRRLNGMTSIDADKEWKVITMFIGFNDLCNYCVRKDIHSPASGMQYVREALDILHNEVPRAFINLVTPGDVTYLAAMSRGRLCHVMHIAECVCGAYDWFMSREEMSAVSAKYRQRLHQLVDSGRYDTRGDFTVVVQPFFEQTRPPLKTSESGGGDMVLDESYIAPDCFHFSQKGHSEAAIALWNNMLQPVGSKLNHLTFHEEIACPTKDHPYFYTSKNSP